MDNAIIKITILLHSEIDLYFLKCKSLIFVIRIETNISNKLTHFKIEAKISYSC